MDEIESINEQPDHTKEYLCFFCGLPLGVNESKQIGVHVEVTTYVWYHLGTGAVGCALLATPSNVEVEEE